jgi:hypothetical protein
MKSESGGFIGEGSGEVGDRVRMMVLPAETAKKRQSRGSLENYLFLALHVTIRM